MQLLTFPLEHPYAFWGVGIIVSLYYGVRAIFIQRHGVANENIDELKKGHLAWTLSEQIIVHRIHDFIFNLAGGLAGFAALYASCKVFNGITDFAAIDGGSAATLVFLVAVAITGATGMLPMLLVHGRLFGAK